MLTTLTSLRPIVRWSLQGVFLGAAFTSPWLWPLGLLGVWLCLDSIERARSWREVIAGTVLMGTIQFGLVLIWFWNVFPLNDFPAAHSLQLGGIFVSWFLCAVGLGVGKLVLTLPTYFFKLSRNVFAVPVLWVLSDMAGALAFSIVSYGSGATVNPYFSFGWLGYLLAEHELFLELARWGGVFVLTILYVLLALLLRWCYSRTPKNGSLYVGTFLTVLFVSSLFVSYEPLQSSYKVAAIEMNQQSFTNLYGKELDYYRALIGAEIEAAIANGNEYIILPEGADFNRFFATSGVLLNDLKNISTNDIVLVDSAWYEHSETESFLRARLFDTKTMQVYEVDKQYLVPQGEFMSYLLAHIMGVVGFGEAAKKFSEYFDYVPGEKKWGKDWPDHLPGVVFCSEAVLPLIIREAARDGEAPFVAHIVSHAWFHEPTILWTQLDQMLKVNSAFSGVTVHQAANMYESKQY